jgi:hypothetical protein
MRHGWRTARFLWPGPNALRRRWDRIESAVMIGLAALFVAAGPLAALGAGRAAEHAVLARAHGEQRWRQVTATLTRRDTERLQSPAGGWSQLLVRARWTAGGRARTGWVPATPAERKRGRTAVWVSPGGALTGPPGALADLKLAAGLAAASGAAGLACLLFLAGAAARGLLDRRRLAGWETAWRAVGPQWSRRP